MRIVIAFVLSIAPLLTVETSQSRAEVTPGINAKLVPIGPAFATRSMNFAPHRRHGLFTVGQQQYAAYYDGDGTINIARRSLSSDIWDITDTGLTDFNSNLTDTHNQISFGIDGNGYMHMTWGMHVDQLVYSKSMSPVTGNNPINFGPLGSMTGQNENIVTYPMFVNLPNGDLLFSARNRGSGNGDWYLNRYNTQSETWATVQGEFLDGDPGQGVPTNNAYPNFYVIDGNGDLHISWVSRYSSNGSQSNHNIYYAKSTDEGQTFQESDGTPYTLPISELNAEIAVPIPVNSSLANQAGMAVDRDNLPVVATYWAPEAAQGNNDRQYMLSWFDGGAWQTSQITNRNTTGGLTRPFVVVDKDNRTIVAIRDAERGNVLSVAYSENRTDWNFLDLADENLGNYTPIFDPSLWERENKLHFLYQPITGQATSTISVLEWDVATYFKGPIQLEIDRTTGQAYLLNSDDVPHTIDGYSIESASAQLNAKTWLSLQEQQLPGWQRANTSLTRLNELNQGGGELLGPGERVALGPLFASSQVAFGEDQPGDLTVEVTMPGAGVDNGAVEYVGLSLNNLILKVNPLTGRGVLINGSEYSVGIDAYTIQSQSGSLRADDESWSSLEDQGALGGDWEEANPDTHALSELILDGYATLSAGDVIDLGFVYDPNGIADLSLSFFREGEPELRDGVVLFSLPGDFNHDGTVEGSDLQLWEAIYSSDVVSAAVTDTDGDRKVTGSEFLAWQRSLGSTFNQASTAAVPESRSLLLALIGFASALGTQPRLSLVRKRKHQAG